MPNKGCQGPEDKADYDARKLHLGVATAGTHQHWHDFAGGFFLRRRYGLFNPLLFFGCKKGLSVCHVYYQLPDAPPPPKPPPPPLKPPPLLPPLPLPPYPLAPLPPILSPPTGP